MKQNNAKKVETVELSELESLKLQLAKIESEKLQLAMQLESEKNRADRLGAELYKEKHTVDLLPSFMKLADNFDFFEGLEKNRTLSYLMACGFLKPEFEYNLKSKLQLWPKDNHKVIKTDKTGTIKENVNYVVKAGSKAQMVFNALVKHDCNLDQVASETGIKRETLASYKSKIANGKINVIGNIDLIK